MLHQCHGLPSVYHYTLMSFFNTCSRIFELSVSHLFLYHCATVTLHISCYCMIGESSFTKADDSTPFKICKKFKIFSLSSVRHSYVSSHVYPKVINVAYFRHTIAILYLYGFSIIPEGAAQPMHAWWL